MKDKLDFGLEKPNGLRKGRVLHSTRHKFKLHPYSICEKTKTPSLYLYQTYIVFSPFSSSSISVAPPSITSLSFFRS